MKKLVSLLAKVNISFDSIVNLTFCSMFFFVCHIQGGETIKEINRRSGAHVELDKTHMPSISNLTERLFKLRGTPDQIVAAQQLMYERVANGPGGAGEILTPIQFQQQFNLPLVGSKQSDGWSNSHDPYGADPNSAVTGDPYSQWMAAYGQWPGSKTRLF